MYGGAALVWDEVRHLVLLVPQLRTVRLLLLLRVLSCVGDMVIIPIDAGAAEGTRGTEWVQNVAQRLDLVNDPHAATPWAAQRAPLLPWPSPATRPDGCTAIRATPRSRSLASTPCSAA